ncbi:DUF2157 domain-containing protein [Acinetobacter nematophilus]|uniref:DUF4401 domain-containing protein n=1 Tax=Acinetobacter nematophilus TaxID=2994642 RepID=A0A9X3DR28_9GAMM|nr:DUF2157 domain-containing protein [Acinetobacter nematophilus]MCX5466533.1 DUF4401 domain-containing protein [Acinetobacter nematophilus]
MLNIQQELYSWRNDHFVQHLQIVGFALIAVSILYLTAANWLMLPHIFQLAIPQVLLLSSALASLFMTQHDYVVQCLHTISGLMLGLSLAVIGQIYQTGADSYLLFLIWSILLLPWLYRPNIGVFSLICIISQLTLFLFFKQTFWADEYPVIFLVSLNLLSLFQFYLCLRYYQKLRYLFILWFGILSIWHMGIFLYADGGLAFATAMVFTLLKVKIAYLLSSFFLLSVALSYFYRKRDQLCSVLSAVGLGITFTLVIFKWMEGLFRESEVLGLFLIALVIFSWFALITYLLIKFIPQNRFNNIPIAVGAWIAGVLLASLMLTFWGNFSLIMGAVFVLLAAFILMNKQALFLRQFAYCIWVAGQNAVIFHTFELTDLFFPIFFIQLILLALSCFIRTHWFFVFIQIFALYLSGIAMIWDISTFFGVHRFVENFSYLVLLSYGFYLVMIWIDRIQPRQYQRSLALANLLIILSSLGFYTLFGQDELDQIKYIPILCLGLPILWLALFMLLRMRNQFSLIAQLILLAFAAVLIFYGYFEIFICIAILSWALSQRDKIVYGLALVTLVLILWFIYYALNVSFLVKSLSIFSSGLLLLILTWVLHKFQIKERVNV